MSSTSTLSLLITRAFVTLAGPTPPTRKNTSWISVGSSGSLACAPPWWPEPTCRSAGELTAPASNSSPERFTPLTSATLIAVSPLSVTSVGKPRPSTTVCGLLTTRLWSGWYTPGGRTRSCPLASSELIFFAESAGRAMKNSPIGMDAPGVAPPVHVGPAELVCSAGTKTLKRPPASAVRKGSSLVTGLAASVVYGGGPPACCARLPKLWGGTLPVSPMNTWFQTALVQPSRLVFLTMNCCWEPLRTVLLENTESAMKPPLEKLGEEQ